MTTSPEMMKAQRGAALLDQKRPGWEWHPEFDNLNTLDIRTGCNCILGKLYDDQATFGRNGYFVGIDELGLNPSSLLSRPEEYGFIGYEAQTEAWREIITLKRRSAMELDIGELVEDGVRTDELIPA